MRSSITTLYSKVGWGWWGQFDSALSDFPIRVELALKGLKALTGLGQRVTPGS